MEGTCRDQPGYSSPNNRKLHDTLCGQHERLSAMAVISLSGMAYVVAKHQQITHLNPVLIDRFAVVAKIVAAHMIHAQAAFLIKGDIRETGIAGSDEQLLIAPLACLRQEPLDKLATI